MSRQFPLLGVVVTALVILTGCHAQQPLYFHEDGDLSHYLGVATEIEYPDVEQESLGEVEGALRPLSLTNSEPKEVWNLTLEEAVHYAVANSKVIRQLRGQVTELSATIDTLLSAPEAVPTVYDPAIDEANPRFGLEAALAAFDAQFTSSLFWEKNDTPRNFAPVVGPIFPTVLQQDLGTFQAQLSKTAATGGTWTLRHNVMYDQSVGPRLFPSDWNVNLEAEMRQPLLQGAGVQFNRIAGPGAIPGFNSGVMIARINTDISLVDFETGIRNLIFDVEKAYWELYYAYRQLDAVVAGRDSALQTWRKVYTLYVVSTKGGEAAKEAQAREQYFLFRSTMEDSLNGLYQVESKLRYAMGLAATDGRLIRPADEPTTAKVAFDWRELHAEALARSPELRRQKWQVKKAELELIAAKNYMLPRLDAVGRYRWLGLGDDLIDSSGGTGNPAAFGSNAYQSMTHGDFQEWQFGLELQIPIGFRKAMSGVRHAQLNLAKHRAVLQEQELELSHQLAFAVRDMEAHRVLTQTNFNRRVAAQRQVKAVDAAYVEGMVTLDQLLDAQRLLAQAESAYYRSLVDYNNSVAEIHYRKGSLLEYNGVYLKEGPWPGKAYFDARRRARARDASFYLDYGFTRPKVVSRGAYDQQAGGGMVLPGGEIEAGEMPEPTLEPIPTPEPMPEPMPSPIEPAGPEPADGPIDPSILEPAVPEPAAPEADLQAVRPEIGTPRAAGAQLAAKLTEENGARATSVLESLKLGRPTERRPGERSTAIGQWFPVRRTSHKEPVRPAGGDNPKGTDTKGVRLKWSNSRSSGTRHEAVANPPAAETDRASSGWKRVQR